MIDNALVKLSKKKHFDAGEEKLRAAILNYNIVKDERDGSLFIGTVGKSHYAPVYSQEEEKAAVKKVQPRKESAEIELRGKRYIEIPKGEDPRPQGTRRIEVATTSESYELDMPIKRKVTGYGQTSVEYDMETSMNRKQRVDPARQRNFIPAAHKGDKAYKEADREACFYAKGGLVVGSSIKERKATGRVKNKSVIDEGSMKNTGKPLSNTKTYTDKLNRVSRDNDITQVMSLTVSIIDA